MAFDLNPVDLGGPKKLANAFSGASLKPWATGGVIGGSAMYGLGKAAKKSVAPKIKNVTPGITQAPALARDMRSTPVTGGHDALTDALGDLGGL